MSSFYLIQGHEDLLGTLNNMETAVTFKGINNNILSLLKEIERINAF